MLGGVTPLHEGLLPIPLTLVYMNEVRLFQGRKVVNAHVQKSVVSCHKASFLARDESRMVRVGVSMISCRL